jgi:pimeloyl-ACP methyl ester carboxylesterase
MNRGFAASVLLALTLIGCQSTGQRPTEAVQVKQMSVNGTNLAYVEQGRGETVVFVHGAFGDWRNWEGMRPRIAEKYRFVALSLRYHYPNAWTDDGKNYSLAQHVDDVAAFIRALNVGKVHLVGNSMGSRIVGYVVLKYPELVRSITMGDPFIVAPTSADAKAAIAAFQKDAALSSAAAKAGDLKQSAILLYNAVLDDADAFQRSSPEAQQRTLDNADSMGPYSRQPPATPVTCEQFGALKVPALVITGENSRAIFRYGSERLLGCLPKGTPHTIIPKGRHNWFSEQADAGAKAVLSFLMQQ